MEDVGIVLGETFAEALGDKAGVRRFASIAVPLDEALVEVALDLSGRPYLAYDVELAPDTARSGHAAVRPAAGRGVLARLCHRRGHHPPRDRRAGRNTHHILEASFKAVARALRDAVRIEGGGVPSTKGTL